MKTTRKQAALIWLQGFMSRGTTTPQDVVDYSPYPPALMIEAIHATCYWSGKKLKSDTPIDMQDMNRAADLSR